MTESRTQRGGRNFLWKSILFRPFFATQTHSNSPTHLLYLNHHLPLTFHLSRPHETRRRDHSIMTTRQHDYTTTRQRGTAHLEATKVDELAGQLPEGMTSEGLDANLSSQQVASDKAVLAFLQVHRRHRRHRLDDTVNTV